MRQRQPNWGAANTSLILVIGSLAILAVLITLLLRIDSSRPASATADGRSGSATSSDPLFVYCAAGMRYPLEEIAAAYGVELDMAFTFMPNSILVIGPSRRA